MNFENRALRVLIMALFQFLQASFANQQAMNRQLLLLLEEQDAHTREDREDINDDFGFLVMGCELLSMRLMNITTMAEVMTLCIEHGTEGMRQWVCLPRANEFSCEYFDYADEHQVHRSVRMTKASFFKLCELLRPYQG